MTKTKILSVLLASLACVALLGSCDYWKEDYYKSGGDSGSQASGGSGSGSTASVPTYSGSMTVNSVAYTTLTMNGTSTSGTATLSGGAANLSGTYARAVAAAAAASEFTGSYTITFSSGTITVTFNGNSITLTNGSITASGTGTLVVQTSGGSGGSGGSSSSGGFSSGGSSSGGSSSGGSSGGTPSSTMTAEEQSVYNSLVGTWKDARDSSYVYTFTIRSNGTIVSPEWETTWSNAHVVHDGSSDSNYYGALEAGQSIDGVWYDDFRHLIYKKSDGSYTFDSGVQRM
ncbi:MAG: hypothetical protein K6G18_01475 [Treponema sp.]|nr:hypothetical protein [Treponema sp.]